jgi:hypothetical protein
MGVSRELRSYVAKVIGGIPGDIYVVTADRSDEYIKTLTGRGIGSGNIYTSFASALDAAKTDANDCILLCPGDHTVTSEPTVDLDVLNIIGMGSKNQYFQPSTLTNGGVRLSCTTSAVESCLNITGHYVSLYGFGTFNSAASTSNVADIKVAGRNFYAENMAFRGGNSTTQTQSATQAGVPVYINSAVAGGGNAARFVNCNVGSAGNVARTKAAGCVYCAGGAAAGFAVEFENCRLTSRIETASGNDVSMIWLAGAYAIDRYLLLKDCVVYNFWENLASKLTCAISDDCTTTHQTLIHHSSAYGIAAWCNVTTYTFVGNMPQSAADGGIGVVCDAS